MTVFAAAIVSPSLRFCRSILKTLERITLYTQWAYTGPGFVLLYIYIWTVLQDITFTAFKLRTWEA